MKISRFSRLEICLPRARRGGLLSKSAAKRWLDELRRFAESRTLDPDDRERILLHLDNREAFNARRRQALQRQIAVHSALRRQLASDSGGRRAALAELASGEWEAKPSTTGANAAATTLYCLSQEAGVSARAYTRGPRIGPLPDQPVSASPCPRRIFSSTLRKTSQGSSLSMRPVNHT